MKRAGSTWQVDIRCQLGHQRADRVARAAKVGRISKLQPSVIQRTLSELRQVDRRTLESRRALEPAEVARLLPVAEHGPVVLGMSGPDRAMCYRLALGTGLRANEVRTLAPAVFNLDGQPPTVMVRAAHSKRRQEDMQPITSELADRLRMWLADKPEGQPVFALPDKPATMLK